MNDNTFGKEQRQICRRFGSSFSPPLPGTKVGFALGTRRLSPINGVRLPAHKDTNGWYIWCGEETSEASDFYEPVHTEHLVELCPAAMPFLALPAGYRFLVDGDYVDVWFDESVLNKLHKS
ncbi:MAG: hypothetical protein JWN44_5777 [Myxococcales bacterium]|nr:hypothetical protein [Myxococcales bacterium]